MRELEADAANPKPRPAWVNGELTTIPLRQLSKRTAVFQPRSLDGNRDNDDDFMKGLVRALKDADGEALDPVTVWWSGRRFYVIDGHHRFEAYKRHFVGKPVNIPCEEFTGTLAEAMEFAGQSNHKNKLPMTQDDRLDFAWRLVCTADRTVDRVRKASGASERVVWAMRKKLREKIEQDKPDDETSYRCELGGMRWRDVRDGGVREEWTDEKTLAEATRMADRLYKQFGSLHKKAHILALALTLRDAKLPMRLIQSEAWEEHRQQIKENEMEDDDENIGEEETIDN